MTRDVRPCTPTSTSAPIRGRCAPSASVIPTLPWIAGLFRWVMEVQPHDGDGFDCVTRLRDLVDGGLGDGSFPLAVSGIVAEGCHAPPCAGGARAGGGSAGSDRTAAFARALRLFGFPAEFDTAA